MLPAGVEIAATNSAAHAEILSPAARVFVVRLRRRFNARQNNSWPHARRRQDALDGGIKLYFLPGTNSAM
jgi:hypothetical protein